MPPQPDISALPKNGIVVLADSSSVFPRIIASAWRELGYSTVILTAQSGQTSVNNEDIVLSLYDYETVYQSVLRKTLTRLLPRIERTVQFPLSEQQRYYNSELSLSIQSPPIRVAHKVAVSYGLASIVKTLCPAFVFAMQALNYGFAASLCDFTTRVVFPYGGDIYIYANRSRYAEWLLHHAFKNVDAILPSAISAVPYLTERFSIPSDRVKSISWGVDHSQFYPRRSDEQLIIKKQYSIPQGKRVILNCRRYDPSWGSEVVLGTFINLALFRDDLHFVLLPGERHYLEPTRQILREMGLEERFTILESQLSLREFAEVASVSEVYVSLMLATDMRSSSVLQAAACGSLPVLSNQREYRAMLEEGFRAQLVPFGDTESTARAILSFLDNPELCAHVRSKNLEFLRQSEDLLSQSSKMIEYITALASQRVIS